MALALTVVSTTSPESGISVSLPAFTVTGTITPVTTAANITGAGTTMIAVPANSVGVVVSPPSTNASTLKYRDNNTDTSGSFVAKTTSSVFFFDSANIPANIYLTAGGSVGEVEVTFF